ncbi:MAG: PSD1 domain-containing protein [Verrucomicrobiaceae bacterium]|nr:PSD1 domain-containing protein [Verrucomicrobiaceae bacterium]
MRAKSFLSLFLASSPLLGADSGEGIEFFEKHVRPILVERCYECHSASKKIKGGLALDTKAGTLQGGDTGPSIVAGDPEKSRFIEAVRYTNQDLQMPPKSPIPAKEVAILEQWVKMGLPDPRSEGSTTSGPRPVNIEEGRKHWAFQPLAQLDAPLAETGAAHPIDAFLLADMKAAGVQPAFSPRADPRTLARRTAYSLTGLPPAPNAHQISHAQHLTELLASPHYGEHWGRHWLDVARYADSNGLDENVAMGHAWRYRDYVVKAFNTDKPYDQFVIEQLAGDLVTSTNDPNRLDALAATGFLALGAKVLAEPDMQKLEMDIIDEQIDTLGKAFLGMTFGCVRCHDHKFDPIRMDDYYAMAAIFRSTRSLADKKTGAIKYWYEHDLATPNQIAAQAEHEKAAKAKAAELKKITDNARKAIKSELLSRAADYLAAAKELGEDDSFSNVTKIAQKHQLRPRYLSAARLYVDKYPHQAVLSKWHALKSPDEVKSHFEPLFRDPTNTAAQAAINDPAGFLAIPDKDADAFDSETVARIEAMKTEVMKHEDATPEPPAIMGVTEGNLVKTIPLHLRGSYLTLGKEVERGFPEVMRTSFTKPILPVRQSGRLQLARWIASPEHPLTARVIVNRVWRWHFGRGLAPTTDNFGTLGEKPDHPQLLDWLARWFIENEWSVKALHRLILTSQVWQQSSGQSPQSDPENKLLSHFPIRRLTAEEIRDSMLEAAGILDRTIGGKTIPQRNREFVFNHTSKDHTTYESMRRALYLPIIRNHLYDILEQFDYPDPTTPTGSRNSTTVAPQALILLNSPLSLQVASSMTAGLPKEDDQRITEAYLRLYYRYPTATEAERCLKFVHSQPDSASAWPLLLQTLIAANEFAFIR